MQPAECSSGDVAPATYVELFLKQAVNESSLTTYYVASSCCELFSVNNMIHCLVQLLHRTLRNLERECEIFA